MGSLMSVFMRTSVGLAAQKLPLLRRCLRILNRHRNQAAAYLAAVISFSILLLLFAICGFSISGLNAGTALAIPANNDLAWSMRGFNYPSWWHDEYLSPQSPVSLDRIAGTGANWITIVPTQYMENERSVVIAPEINGRTASDAALARAIDDAHARGLKVLLKPHVDVSNDIWRGEIQPDDAHAWFSSYRTMMDGYARLANAHGVEMIAVGTELASMSGPEYAGEWNSVIGLLRSLYSGPLTYAASQNEYNSVCFWGSLDFLGIDIYFPLSDAGLPSIDELAVGWTGYNGFHGRANWVESLESWQARWNKPVIFTELGYRSVRYTARSHWDYSSAGDYDGDLQARAYETVFRVFGNRPWLAGVFWWDWSVTDNGGLGDTNYTIINKPAEAVVSNWYTGGANLQPSLTVESGNVSWTSYADYRERLLHVTYQVSNNGGTARRVSVLGGTAGSGVILASGLPVDIGDLPQGASTGYSATYRVPQGITAFRAVPYISYVDIAGTTHYLPLAPPVPEG